MAMLTLNDGRTELWQWDTGRTLAVDADCSQVHFSNKVFGRSIDVDVIDGVAIIPDILLQTDKDLNVWAFAGTADNGYTKISKTFKVNRRNKPADYVFTPTDQMTLQTIQSQIGDLSDLTTAAKDTLVAAINEAAASGGAGSVSLRVSGGYIQYSTDGGSTWQNLIAVADLKGDKGDTGPQGPQGPAGVADISLSVTGATVGQIAKITAVDDSGKPTAWEAVDDRLPNASPSDAGKVLAVEQTGEFEYGYGFADMPKMFDFINLGIDAASPGQIAKITAVDDSGKPTAWEAVDDRLPNASPSDAGKVLAVEQTGEFEYGYGFADMPKMFDFINLGIDAASPGQFAKVAHVDDFGRPTAWEAVDMPSGGGGSGETWEEINAITLSDAVNTVTINTDSGGNAIALKKVRILVEGSATHNQDLFLNNSRYIREQVVGTEASVGALSAEPFCGKMYCFVVKNIRSNYESNSQFANIFSGEITITDIKLIVTNSGTFSAGTKFTIQGVKA